MINIKRYITVTACYDISEIPERDLLSKSQIKKEAENEMKTYFADENLKKLNIKVFDTGTRVR